MKKKIILSVAIFASLLSVTLFNTFATEMPADNTSWFQIEKFSVYEGAGELRNSILVEWKYDENFDPGLIVAIDVGIKDFEGNTIMSYRADNQTICRDSNDNPNGLNQIEWQKENGYITSDSKSRAFFFQTNRQKEFEIGPSWTTQIGSGYGEWSPYSSYVTIHTSTDSRTCEDFKFVGTVYPSIMAVADGIYYYELQEAIQEVRDGGEITLIRNTMRESNDVGYSIPKNKTVIIRGNGHLLHRVCADLDASGGYRGHAIFTLNQGSHLILDNVRLTYLGNCYGKDPENSATGICMGYGFCCDGGSLTIQNSSEIVLGTLCGGIVQNHASNITIQDSLLDIHDIEGDATNGGNYLLQDHAFIDIENCRGHGFGADKIQVERSHIEVDNAAYTGIYANNIDGRIISIDITNCGSGSDMPAEFVGKGAFQLVENEANDVPNMNLYGTNIYMEGNSNSGFLNDEIIYVGYGNVQAEVYGSSGKIKPAPDADKYVVAARDMHVVAKLETVPNLGYFVLPPDPGYTDYTFLGWSDGKDTYGANDIVQITEDKFFTCVWGHTAPTDPDYSHSGSSDDAIVI